MKILKKIMKDGIVKVKIETPSDLWHLEKIIEPGDFVKSVTTRKTVISRGKGNIKSGERKKMVLTIEAEKTELTDNYFRITGPIKEGPEDIQLNSYHTLNVELGTEITIRKEWKKYHLDRLKNAQQIKPLVLICVLDREAADIALLKESGLDRIAKVRSSDPENREEYYAEITSLLEKQKSFGAFIIAGPGFERENLLKYLKGKKSELAPKAHLEHASSAGLSGINEVLKSSAESIVTSTRISEETKAVEKVLEEIKKDGLAVYGKKETEEAVNAGAVKKLLVSEKKVREFEKLMDTMERMKGEVLIIGDDHSAGEQFLHMGGIAGLLRYKLNY